MNTDSMTHCLEWAEELTWIQWPMKILWALATAALCFLGPTVASWFGVPSAHFAASAGIWVLVVIGAVVGWFLPMLLSKSIQLFVLIASWTAAIVIWFAAIAAVSGIVYLEIALLIR